jgi:hypothetical protein
MADRSSLGDSPVYVPISGKFMNDTLRLFRLHAVTGARLFALRT